MKLLHTSATRCQGRLWRPQCRPIILERCIFGVAKVYRNGMVHALTLSWSLQMPPCTWIRLPTI